MIGYVSESIVNLVLVFHLIDLLFTFFQLLHCGYQLVQWFFCLLFVLVFKIDLQCLGETLFSFFIVLLLLRDNSDIIES